MTTKTTKMASADQVELALKLIMSMVHDDDWDSYCQFKNSVFEFIPYPEADDSEELEEADDPPNFKYNYVPYIYDPNIGDLLPQALPFTASWYKRIGRCMRFTPISQEDLANMVIKCLQNYHEDLDNG